MEGGHELLRFGGRQLPHVHPEAPLQLHALVESAQVLLARDQEEVADPREANIHAELVAEALEDAEGFQREADLGLGGELGPDAAGRLAGGA